MANGWNPLIGIGFTALGIGYLYEAFGRNSTPTPVGGGFGRSTAGFRPGLPIAQLEGRSQALGYTGPKAGQQISTDSKGRKVLTVSDGVRTIKFYEAGSIENRLRFIIDQMKKDSSDPKTISEVTTILSGKCPVERGGLDWCVKAKKWNSEIAMLFYAVTNPNSPYALRYTRDHAHIDMFRSSDLMRRIPIGDCDDFTIRLGAWLLAIGYSVKCRIVAPAGQPGQWAHIYLMAGTPPGENTKWIPLDPTEPQHGFGWEVPKSMISSVRDFEVRP
jgi:hypothetical protein